MFPVVAGAAKKLGGMHLYFLCLQFLISRFQMVTKESLAMWSLLHGASLNPHDFKNFSSLNYSYSNNWLFKTDCSCVLYYQDLTFCDSWEKSVFHISEYAEEVRGNTHLCLLVWVLTGDLGAASSTQTSQIVRLSGMSLKQAGVGCFERYFFSKPSLRRASHMHRIPLSSFITEQEARNYHWYLYNPQYEISFFKASISS